jgi:DNA-binding response OmpR family regulator
VLVAEDDQTVRELICRTLRQDGYRVLEAIDGRDALAVLEREPGAVDLLITDVAMPKMGGRELSGHFARLRHGAPTLFISAYPAPEMIRRELLEEGLPFLEKPFTPDALAIRVQQLLKSTAGATGHAEHPG